MVTSWIGGIECFEDHGTKKLAEASF